MFYNHCAYSLYFFGGCRCSLLLALVGNSTFASILSQPHAAAGTPVIFALSSLFVTFSACYRSCATHTAPPLRTLSPAISGMAMK